MDLVEELFRRSGKKIEDLQFLADEIMQLTQTNPTYQRGSRLMAMMNDLSHTAIGPEHLNPEEHSDARQLIASERKLLSDQMQPWIFSTTFTKDDLIVWLKRYYAIEYYARNFKLANEFMEGLIGQTKKSTQH